MNKPAISDHWPMNHQLFVAVQLLTNTANWGISRAKTYVCLHWGCWYQGVILGSWILGYDQHGYEQRSSSCRSWLQRISRDHRIGVNSIGMVIMTSIAAIFHIVITAIWGYCGFLHRTWTSICHELRWLVTVYHDWYAMIYCDLPSCTRTLPSSAMCCARVCHCLYAMICRFQPGTVTKQHEPSSFAL